MQATVTGYYGHTVREPIDREHTWENVQEMYRETCPEWHDGTLVNIHRDDNGAAYNAPGAFTCTDRAGNTFAVVLED